jgi:thiamine pyrophosphate-dependent acetolactate synthase large subunit-like protein
LLKLAERLQIPVAASASGLGAIDCNHPLALGLLPRAGHYQANHATRQSDVLLALQCPASPMVATMHDPSGWEIRAKALQLYCA